jgi:hypothetical protein
LHGAAALRATSEDTMKIKMYVKAGFNLQSAARSAGMTWQYEHEWP